MTPIPTKLSGSCPEVSLKKSFCLEFLFFVKKHDRVETNLKRKTKKVTKIHLQKKMFNAPTVLNYHLKEINLFRFGFLIYSLKVNCTGLTLQKKPSQ